MKNSVREPVAVVQVGFNKELDKADLWNLEGADRRQKVAIKKQPLCFGQSAKYGAMDESRKQFLRGFCKLI